MEKSQMSDHSSGLWWVNNRKRLLRKKEAGDKLMEIYDLCLDQADYVGMEEVDEWFNLLDNIIEVRE
jgi:hypothetical protein